MQVLKFSSRSFVKAEILVVLAILSSLGALVGSPQAPRSDNLIIYQPGSHSSVPLHTIDQVPYVPLLSALNAVGKVGAIQEKRDSIKVWFGETDIELRQNDRRVRLGKARLELAAPVRKPGSQWFVPVQFLTDFLPRLTQKTVEYHTGATRLFLGGVHPLSLSVRFEARSAGTRIALRLSEKVNIRNVSTDGKWYIYLGEKPIQPSEETYRYQDAYISEIHFDDQDGVPKLIIAPAASGLNFVPTSEDGGKVLLADIYRPVPALPPPAPGAEQAQLPPNIPGLPEGLAPAEEAPTTPGPPLPVVVLDAAHGGEDSGAQARDGVLEKDIAAQLANRVRLALIAGRKFRIQLTRTGDLNPSFDQREITANSVRPAAFISFHAGDLGNITPRIAVLSYRSVQPELNQPLPLLIPWNEAQRYHGEESRRLAQMLQARLAQVQGLAADPAMEGPVRSLRSINCPAVAIELGSLNPAQDSGAITSVALQQQIATALVAGLEGFRNGKP